MRPIGLPRPIVVRPVYRFFDTMKKQFIDNPQPEEEPVFKSDILKKK